MIARAKCHQNRAEIILFTAMSWLLITMSNVGKVGVCLAFTALAPYTTELFPTVIRNTVAGFVGSCGRIGTLIAPQLAFLVCCTFYVVIACTDGKSLQRMTLQSALFITFAYPANFSHAIANSDFCILESPCNWYLDQSVSGFIPHHRHIAVLPLLYLLSHDIIVITIVSQCQ